MTQGAHVSNTELALLALLAPPKECKQAIKECKPHYRKLLFFKKEIKKCKFRSTRAREPQMKGTPDHGKTHAKLPPDSFASFELPPGGGLRRRKPLWPLRPERGCEPFASAAGPARLDSLADDVMRGLGRKPE